MYRLLSDIHTCQHSRYPLTALVQSLPGSQEEICWCTIMTRTTGTTDCHDGRPGQCKRDSASQPPQHLTVLELPLAWQQDLLRASYRMLLSPAICHHKSTGPEG